MLIVADLIEKHTELFDMQNFVEVNPECGTCGCIAGFAQMAVKLNNSQGGYADPYKFLDLPFDQGQELFYAKGVWVKYNEELRLTHPYGFSLSDITPDRAITMLRNLASGEWSFDTQ
jgi:hypothetical protein